MNNQNPNKRRGNFTTQQQRKRQKQNQFQSRGGRPNIQRGRGFRLVHNRGGRGRGRGPNRGQSNRGRGRGRGRGRNQPKLIPQKQLKPIPKLKPQSQPTIPSNIPITRTVSNPPIIKPKPVIQPTNTKPKSISELRAAALASQTKSQETSPKKPMKPGVSNPQQIEQQMKLKKAHTAPAPNTNSNLAQMLRQKALRTMPNTNANQKQPLNAAEIENQKRKQLLIQMKNAKKSQTQIQSNLNPNANTFKPKATNITINNSPSHSNILPRKLTAYRKEPKSMNNITFTTTSFDTNNKAFKTFISTNDPNQNKGHKIPPLPANIPPAIPVNTATVAPKPKIQSVTKPKPIAPKVIPKPLQSSANILGNNALNWSCSICTYDNKNNASLVCQMCAKTNKSKKPIPTREKKPQANVSKPKQISNVSKPIQTQKRIATPMETDNTTMSSNVVAKPKPAPMSKPIPKLSTVPLVKPKIIPQKQLKPIPMKIDTDEIWNQRDKAIKERQVQNTQTQINKQMTKPVAKIVKKPVNKSVVNTVRKPVVTSVQKVIIPTPITHNEIQKKKMNVVKPMTNVTQNVNVSKPQTQTQPPRIAPPNIKKLIPIAKNKIQSQSQPVAVMKKPIIKKPIAKQLSKVVKAPSPLPSLKDCWKLDVKKKVNTQSLELFIKETDTFIKGMDIDLKEECKNVGIEYINVYDMNNNNGILYDIVEDFEWTKKMCEKYDIEWKNDMDMNVFSNVVRQCDEW